MGCGPRSSYLRAALLKRMGFVEFRRPEMNDLGRGVGETLQELRCRIGVPRLKSTDGGHSFCTNLTLSSLMSPDWSCCGGGSQMNQDILRSCDLCGSNQIMVLDAESNICKCGACGYVFDNPRPTTEEVAIFYSKPGKYDLWVREEEARDLLWTRRLRKMEKTKKSGSLLDVGTGAGQFLHHASILLFSCLRHRGLRKWRRACQEEIWLMRKTGRCCNA